MKGKLLFSGILHLPSKLSVHLQSSFLYPYWDQDLLSTCFESKPNCGGMEHWEERCLLNFSFFFHMSSNSKKEFQSPTLRLCGGSTMLLLKRFEQRGSSSCTWNSSLHNLLYEKHWSPIIKLSNCNVCTTFWGRFLKLPPSLGYVVSSQRFWYFFLLVERETVTLVFFWSFEGDEKPYEIISVVA